MKILLIVSGLLGGASLATALAGTGYEWLVALGAAILIVALFWNWEKSK